MTLESPQAVEFFTNAYNRISFLKEFNFALYYFHVCLWLCRGIRRFFLEQIDLIWSTMINNKLREELIRTTVLSRKPEN